MRKFSRDLYYCRLTIPHVSEDLPMFEFLKDNAAAGTLREVLCRHPLSFDLSLLSLKSLGCINSALWSFSSHVSYVGSGYKVLLEEYELQYLLSVYKIMYGSYISADKLSSFGIRYKQLEWNGEVWGSQNSLSKRSSYILAAWCGTDGEVNTQQISLRPGMVCHYLKHNIELPSSPTPVSHIFAAVKWHMSHPNRNLLGDPVEIWCENLFEMMGPSKYVPINRIHSQFVAGFYRHQEESVLCVCPTTVKGYV